jgi:3-oxoacyl-[acyl-carrier protein] reductase
MKDKVCIITGAGQGIGRAMAVHFATRGCRVVVAECNAASGLEVAAEISARGGTALAIETDVAKPSSVSDMVMQTQQAYGGVDVLISNARWSSLAPTPVQDITDEDWNKAMAVNVTGAFNCVRAVVPLMIAAGSGRIIIMSSSTVWRPPNRPYVHYISSKAALIGMTRALAVELGPHGITVNAILPGSIETGVARPNPVTSEDRELSARTLQAIPRVLTPNDLVGTAYFLASQESSFITGQSIAVNGGTNFN